MVYKLGTHVDFCGYRNIHLSVCVPEPCLALRRTELHSRAEWRLEIRGVEAIREEAWEPIGRREREHAIAKIRGKIGVVENFETLLSIRECAKFTFVCQSFCVDGVFLVFRAVTVRGSQLGIARDPRPRRPCRVPVGISITPCPESVGEDEKLEFAGMRESVHSADGFGSGDTGVVGTPRRGGIR